MPPQRAVPTEGIPARSACILKAPEPLARGRQAGFNPGPALSYWEFRIHREGGEPP